MEEGQWIVRVSPDFLDDRKTPMSDRARHLALVLDSFARTDAYCFPSTETLAQQTGRHERKVQEVLAEMEAAGWIRRLHDARKKRLGIILLHRVGPGTPAADTPERLAEAEAAVLVRRNRRTQHAESGTPGTPISASPGMPKAAPELGIRETHDAVNHDDDPAAASARASSSAEEEATPDDIQGLVLLTGLLFAPGPALERGLRALLASYSVDEVRRALCKATRHYNGGGTVTWKYLRGILENQRADPWPDPIPPRPKPEPAYLQPFVAPPPDPNRPPLRPRKAGEWERLNGQAPVTLRPGNGRPGALSHADQVAALKAGREKMLAEREQFIAELKARDVS
jgi:hypothetical protein